MAQLKSGSTIGGSSIKTTSSSWGYTDMAFTPTPTVTEGYIKRSSADKFELVAKLSDNVTG